MKQNIKQCACGYTFKPGLWYTWGEFCDNCGEQTKKFGKVFSLNAPEEGNDYCEVCQNNKKGE
jgi:hypothetical protein